jgi:hypothetical protein
MAVMMVSVATAVAVDSTVMEAVAVDDDRVFNNYYHTGIAKNICQ